MVLGRFANIVAVWVLIERSGMEKQVFKYLNHVCIEAVDFRKHVKGVQL